MKIRTRDKVKIISGKKKDKGKVGEVIKSFPKENKIVVKDINLVKRHIKKSGANPGQIITFEKSIDASNVMIVCPFTGKATRVGFIQIKEKGVNKKYRFSKIALKEKGGESSQYIIK